MCIASARSVGCARRHTDQRYSRRPPTLRAKGQGGRGGAAYRSSAEADSAKKGEEEEVEAWPTGQGWPGVKGGSDAGVGAVPAEAAGDHLSGVKSGISALGIWFATANALKSLDAEVAM